MLQLTGINSNELGVVHFKVESLQCRVGLNQQNMQSLHIKVQPLPEHKDQWTLEELQVRLNIIKTDTSRRTFTTQSLTRVTLCVHM